MGRILAFLYGLVSYLIFADSVAEKEVVPYHANRVAVLSLGWSAVQPQDGDG